jgi:hypothetical protein
MPTQSAQRIARRECPMIKTILVAATGSASDAATFAAVTQRF